MSSQATYLENADGAYIEELYLRYREDPDSVDPSWQQFFEGYEFSSQDSSLRSPSQVDSKEVNVVKLIQAYRTRGHLLADTNPIKRRREHKADLELKYFDLSEKDLKEEFSVGKEIKIGKSSLGNILEHLKNTYGKHIGVEFRHLRNEQLRQWLYNEMETNGNKPEFSTTEKKQILKKLSQAANFEEFLQKKYLGKKRFSIEGVEAVIPGLDEIISTGAEYGAKEFVLGMAHRGRLNVLVNIFGKTYEDIFKEFEEVNVESGETIMDEYGDVKYHLGNSSDVKTPNGKDVHLSLLPNPSHLEAVNPVVHGIGLAKIKNLYNNDVKALCPILIHGDAALAGQGIIYEQANLVNVEGYGVGGIVHVVLNNQVGFTAGFTESRSNVYCTEIARVMEAPVFHVNADDPEIVVHAMRLAIKIRQLFKIDVFVDIVGYRRHGHNEGDEPRFTQPTLYSLIDKHPNVSEIYEKELVEKGVMSLSEVQSFKETFRTELQTQLDEARSSSERRSHDSLSRVWTGLRTARSEDFEKSPETGVKEKTLIELGNQSIKVPADFNLFSKMKRVLKARDKNLNELAQADWALAESLAYASLLVEGHPIRISGQDSQRGTFSHRHAIWKDQKNENNYSPLNHLQENQADFEIYNSVLSEYCILGLEYGYSLATPKGLTIWEAQFGDFANGAQIVIDQFITAAESKWKRMSGLVLFLPHGYEGQGPEHSSAHMERYLQLCAENNMYVCNVTTPANLFHLLRRQLKLPFRKPLVLFTPKSLLRHPKVISPLSELAKGGFKEVIDDPSVKAPEKVKRVIFCSGKVYYDLLEEKEKNEHEDVAIVRLEQLYPLPEKQINQIIKKYSKVERKLLVQEEPENKGIWAFVLRKLRSHNFEVVARPEVASPATGYMEIHRNNQKRIVEKAFGQ